MNFLSRFFQGRNGSDTLNIALLVLSVVFSILSRFFFATLFYLLGYAALFLCLFRMLSRNIEKRQAENEWFLDRTQGIRSALPGRGKSRANSSSSYAYANQATGTTRPARPARVKKDRANYRYFKCPNCKQPMRVPRGKGKVKVKCSKCSLEFYKKV